MTSCTALIRIEGTMQKRIKRPLNIFFRIVVEISAFFCACKMVSGRAECWMPHRIGMSVVATSHPAENTLTAKISYEEWSPPLLLTVQT